MQDVPRIAAAGQAVRALREEAGLSLKDVADQLGWHKGRLSKYENNRLALSLPAIEAIAGALKQYPEVVVLRCLKCRYPSLSRSTTGRLMQQLVDELGKPARRR